MGHKQSKSKGREGSSNSIGSNGSVGGEPKMKKKSRFTRRLTKAFSTKKSHHKEEPMDNTYASSIQTTMKRTNSDGSLTSPRPIHTSVTLSASPKQSQSITGLSISPRGGVVGIVPPLQRSETLSTPHQHSTDVTAHESAADGGEDPTRSPRAKRSNSTSSFLKYGNAGRAVALPKRMSKAYAFHQQIAAKEISQRGDELQKIMDAEKPICDIFEENPFKKGFCRLCKHPKSIHRDPYSDILDDLEDC